MRDGTSSLGDADLLRHFDCFVCDVRGGGGGTASSLRVLGDFSRFYCAPGDAGARRGTNTGTG